MAVDQLAEKISATGLKVMTNWLLFSFLFTIFVFILNCYCQDIVMIVLIIPTFFTVFLRHGSMISQIVPLNASYFSTMFVIFQVVRLCAKSREAVSSPVEHLTLHYQVSSSQSLSSEFECSLLIGLLI